MTLISSSQCNKKDKLLVLYASQTGNAEMIAKNINEVAIERGFTSSVMTMNEFVEYQTGKEVSEFGSVLFILVTSTTGDGDPPDNGVKFWRYLRKCKSSSPFHNSSKYCLLGLGDTNYSNFNNNAERLDKKLLEFGACAVLEKGLADDAVGLELVVDEWIERLWKVLDEHVSFEVGRRSRSSEVGDSAAAALSFKIANLGLKKKASKTDEEEKTSSKVDDGNKENTLVSDNGTKDNTKGDIVTKEKSVDETPFPIVPLLKDRAQVLEGITQLTNVTKMPPVFCQLVEEEQQSSDQGKARSIFDLIKDGQIGGAKVFSGQVESVRLLTAPDAVKRALQMKISIGEGEGEFTYSPGDSIAIYPPNDESLVLKILSALGITDIHTRFNLVPNTDSNADSKGLPTHIPNGTSYFEALLYFVDVTGLPKKAFFRMLADYCSSEEDKNLLMFLCSKQGSNEYRALASRSVNLLDILSFFQSCKAPFVRIIENLLPMQPRSYSITSSPIKSPRAVGILFHVTEYEVNVGEGDKIKRSGICTSWLNRLAIELCHGEQKLVRESGWISTSSSPSVRIPVIMRPSPNFGLPSEGNPASQLIMIGPGTGIAPFLSFIEHLNISSNVQEESTSIPTWLFFGCRKKDEYSFEEDLKSKDSALNPTRLSIAYSREDNAVKVYVQDLFKQYSQDLVNQLIDEKNLSLRLRVSRQTCKVFYNNMCESSVYRDGANMAKDVHEELIRIVGEVRGISGEEATKLVFSWMQSKRYLREIWS